MNIQKCVSLYKSLRAQGYGYDEAFGKACRNLTEEQKFELAQAIPDGE